MLGERRNDRIVQRGIDEAFACQDMLERAPPRRPLLERTMAWIAASLRTPPFRAGCVSAPARPAAARRIS